MNNRLVDRLGGWAVHEDRNAITRRIAEGEPTVAKKALIAKAARKPKFGVRGYTRCQRCGRPHSVYRKFGLCRVCLREMAHRGELPGVTKSSW